MTAHDHSTYVSGCYRCELAAGEVVPRPWPANADDGCHPGDHWYERGRFAFWLNVREIVFGIEVHAGCDWDRSFVVLRVWPFWFSWEITRG